MEKKKEEGMGKKGLKGMERKEEESNETGRHGKGAETEDSRMEQCRGD